MDARFWNILELPAILNRLADYASFAGGRERAHTLTPSADPVEVRRRLQETAEARALLAVEGGVTLHGAHDLRPQIENAVRGRRLLAQDLLRVYDTLVVARRLRRSLIRREERFPILASIAHRIDPCPALADEIERCLDERGQVLDRASAELMSIRAEVRAVHERLMERLERILNAPRNARYLQEKYITQRDGRYVLPVKAECKGYFPGIVHDRSASGATLFVEPLATVELNNRWRELQVAEEHEVERILLELSGLVAAAADELRQTLDALARLDLAFAKARYADHLRASMPEMVEFAHPGAIIDLRQARHPLLDPAKVVPIDFALTDDYFIVVITGPNTGGKTVALKTIGLLALMAQCGLHLPVDEGSRLSVFDHICADIGDEQSIEQSLSTFSSHMGNIVNILRVVSDRSLVLLDELGAGTDPLEGAALAQSLLIHLRQRRVTTVATTHYPELKTFAYETPGMVNACVEFDPETLAPTYRLTIGLPGQSNALAIAARLGLAEVIVRRAQSFLSSDHLDAGRLLAQIRDTQAQAERARLEAEAAAARWRSRLDGVEQERQRLLAQAREEALAELEALRAELRELRRQLRRAPPTPTTVARVESKLDALARQIVPERDDGGIAVGDTVWLEGLDATGEVIALDEERAEVLVGTFKVRTRRSSLRLRRKGPTQPTGGGEVVLPPSPPVGLELHLRGMRVADALSRLDRYLDEAFRAHVPFVRIVHGKGTGALRQAVREFLSHHPLVGSFRSGREGEGDTGVTVVEFAYS